MMSRETRPFGVALCLTVVLAATAGAQSISGTPLGKGLFNEAQALQLLADRTSANRAAFYVFKDHDEGANHGFASQFWSSPPGINLLVETACVEDPLDASGCTTVATTLDKHRGTIMRITAPTLLPAQSTGFKIVEPVDCCGTLSVGYDLTGATHLAFRGRSPHGLTIHIEAGGCHLETITLTSDWTEFFLPLDSIPCPGATDPINDMHQLFGLSFSGPMSGGETAFFDRVRYEPVPARQTTDERALSFPKSLKTFGVVPLQGPSGGCVELPPDQVAANLSSTYESALVLMALLEAGTRDALQEARWLADAFVYALSHPLTAVPPTSTTGAHERWIPEGPAGEVGLSNAYRSGDLGLQNDQPPGGALAGQAQLAGFTCGPTGYCLYLDGATGGNNAFAALALLRAYRALGDTKYKDAAFQIGGWITGLEGTDGYLGYVVGYPDEGVFPKQLEPGKSVENNADVFAALVALAHHAETSAEARVWLERALVAGDFVLDMHDQATGSFFAGTVPFDTTPKLGIEPDLTTQKGNEVINRFEFIDAATFTTLALSQSPPYSNAIDWRLPLQHVRDTFDVCVTVGQGPSQQQFCGFGLTSSPQCPTGGPAIPGVAWEFTSQLTVTMRLVDELWGSSTWSQDMAIYRQELGKAQAEAPFADGRGLVAATLQDGDTLPPLEHSLVTPFQDIPQRVGLAATTWALFAQWGFNPLFPLTPWTDLGHGLAGSQGTPALIPMGTLQAATPATLLVKDAEPNANAFLFFGPSALETPFKGGVMVPNFSNGGFILAEPVDSQGELQVSGTWPTGVKAGTQAFFQAWIQDPGGPAGLAATNAVVGTAP
jgi:hypothetical protein